MRRLEYLGPAHLGYLDGLRGNDPNPSGMDEYATGWLVGSHDRTAGVPDVFGDPPEELRRGTRVRIKKGATIKTTYHGVRQAGRSYVVTLHDVYQVTPAYIEYRGEFRRPEPAKVIWPGTGGYWSECAACDVELVTEKKDVVSTK